MEDYLYKRNAYFYKFTTFVILKIPRKTPEQWDNKFKILQFLILSV